VLGVAGLIAILVHIAPADPVPGYRHGLILIIAFFAAAGVVAAALLTGRPVLAPAVIGPAVIGPAAADPPGEPARAAATARPAVTAAQPDAATGR
jgi:hypothetical protein